VLVVKNMDYDLTLKTNKTLDGSVKKELENFHFSQVDDMEIIRLSIDNAASTLDELILKFIYDINSAATNLPMGSILDVAIYFDSKMANLNISLNDKTIKKLSNMSMAINLCCYPCSD